MKPVFIFILTLSQATPCTHCHCGGKRQTSPNHKQPPATAKSPSMRRQKKAPVAKETVPVNPTVTVEVKNSERITESTEITSQVTADERRELGGGGGWGGFMFSYYFWSCKCSLNFTNVLLLLSWLKPLCHQYTWIHGFKDRDREQESVRKEGVPVSEHGRQQSMSEQGTQQSVNEQYANGSVEASVRLIIRGGC